jgi:hypothetical protein
VLASSSATASEKDREYTSLEPRRALTLIQVAPRTAKASAICRRSEWLAQAFGLRRIRSWLFRW